jgi:hypothetical protein
MTQNSGRGKALRENENTVSSNTVISGENSITKDAKQASTGGGRDTDRPWRGKEGRKLAVLTEGKLIWDKQKLVPFGQKSNRRANKLMR